MKKLLLAILLVGSTAVTALAQSESGKFSIGFEAGLPLGDAKDAYNVVLGGSLKYDIPIAQSTFFTLSAGYNAFMTKDEYKALGYKSSYGFVPVKAGIKYFFDQGFYGEAQAGATFSTESGGGTAFAYAPGIGYAFPGGFDLGVRYEAWSKNGTTSQAGLRLAYSF